MSNWIKCGEFNSTYKFLFFSILFSFLEDLAFGSGNVAVFQYFKLLDCANVSNCFLVRQTFCYFFSIIIALILFKKESKYIYDEHNKTLKKLDINDLDRKTTATGEVELIHNEQTFTEYPNKYLIIIIFFWILEEQILSVFKDVFLHLDFWMIELIIIHHFMIKMLKMKVYSHQKLMLWFCIVPIMLKLATIILSILDDNNYINDGNYKYPGEVDKLKIIYIAIPWLSALALPIYFVLIIFRSYVDTKIKWLMDFKFVSISKIFLLYSIIGFVFCLVSCIISSFIICEKSPDTSSDKNTIYDYFCKVKDEFDNNNKYFDNFLLYFKSFNTKKDYYKEIIGLIFGIPFFILYKFFNLKIIQSLTPVHIIFSFPIFYILNKSYLLVLNYLKSEKQFCYLSVKFAKEKLILDFSSDAVSIIGYLIYLEIIELHFCKFDYDVRRNILDRCQLKTNKTDLNISIKTGDDSDFIDEQRAESEKDDEEEKYV